MLLSFCKHVTLLIGYTLTTPISTCCQHFVARYRPGTGPSLKSEVLSYKLVKKKLVLREFLENARQTTECKLPQRIKYLKKQNTYVVICI